MGDALRAVHVCANYPPIAGGHGVYARELARAARPLGVESLVVTSSDTPSVPGAYPPVEGLPAYRVRALEYPLFGPGFSRRLARLVERERADAVNVHTRFFTSTLLAALGKARLGVPLLLTEHGAGHVRHRSGLVAGSARLFDATWGRYAARRADAAIAVSEASRAFLRALGREGEIPLVPNSVDVARLRREAAAALRPPSDAPRVLYVGRLVESKGVGDLVEAFARVRSRRDARLEVVGDGPDGEALRRLAARRLPPGSYEFHGSRDDVPAFLASAALFVNPSRYDNLPTTVLEAGALGRRVVAADVGETRAVLGEDPARLFPPGDLDALEKALEAGLDAGPSDAALARVVESRYDWAATARVYRRVLESTVSSYGGAPSSR